VILPDVIEEHFDEACFLWKQRARVLGSRIDTLRELVRTEERLLAHIDGLIVGGPAAWALLEPSLEAGNERQLTVLGWVVLDAKEEARIQQLGFWLIGAAEPRLRGVTNALSVCQFTDVEQLVRPWLLGAHWQHRAAAAEVLGFRRLPIEDRTLRELLEDHHPLVVNAALRSVGRLRRQALLPSVEALLEHSLSSVRTEALSTAALLGSSAAATRFCTLASYPERASDDELAASLILLGIKGDRATAPLLEKALAAKRTARSAVSALAAAGWGDAISMLLDAATMPQMARMLGSAVQRITGVSLREAQLLAPPVALRTLDEELVELDTEDSDLPLVDVERVRQWWQTQSNKYDPASRYCYGRPLTAEALHSVLDRSPLADRRELAATLALLDADMSPLLRETCGLVAGSA